MNMELKEYIYDRYNQLGNEKIKGPQRIDILKTEVKDKFDFIIKNEDQVRRIVCDIKKIRENIQEYKGKINEIKSVLKRDISYEVVGDEYIITVKDKDTEACRLFRFKKSEVRSMFRDFSIHGGNKSGEEMIANYCNGYPEVWHLIKSRFKLYKTSHIIDPDTLENSTAEELDEAMSEATNYHIDVKKQKLKKKFDESIKTEYFKLLDRFVNGEVYIDKIASIISKYTPEDYSITKLPDIDYKLHAFGADEHNDGSKEGDEGFINMISDLCEVPDKRIVISIDGDNLETLVEGGMHAGQINTMEKTGKNLINHYIALWEWGVKTLIEKGKEVEIVYIVDSNHMRIDDNNKKDKEKIGGWLLLSYLQLKLDLLGAEVKLLEEKTNSFRSDGFHFILDHGHDGFNKKSAKDIVYEMGGNKNEWNIIVSAHEHHLDQSSKNPAKNILWVRLPALKVKQGDYEKGLLLSSNPGYVLIRKDKRGNPRPETIFV